MPRRKRTIIDEVLPAEEEKAAPEEQDEDEESGGELEEVSPEQLEIDEVCAQLADQRASVRIYRRVDNRDTYCENQPLETFAAGDGIEFVKNKYGGGEYKAQFISNGRIAKTVRFSIDKRIKGSIEAAPEAQTDNTTLKLAEMISSKGNDVPAMMGTFLQVIQQQNSQMLQVLAAMGNKSNPIKDFAPLAASLVPLFSKLIESRAQDSTLKSIEAIARIKELFAPVDGGGGSDDMGGQLVKLLGPIVAAKMASAGAPTAPPAAPVETPASLPAPAPAPTAPAEPSSDDPMFIKSKVIEFVRGQLPALNAAAKKDSDPGSYADVLADQLDDQPAIVIQTFLDVLAAPDWRKQFFGDAALINEKWFADFRKAFADAYEIELAEEPAGPVPITIAPPEDGTNGAAGLVPGPSAPAPEPVRKRK